MDCVFMAAGHHATEKYGVQALGAWLRDTHGLTVSFFDEANPV
jgi:putative NIF3 family GTP cyclohydrolase 1 type 2